MGNVVAGIWLYTKHCHTVMEVRRRAFCGVVSNFFSYSFVFAKWHPCNLSELQYKKMKFTACPDRQT